MLKNRLMSVFAIAGLGVFAACGGDGADLDTEMVTQDTITQPGVETVPVEVPVTDSAIVTTEVDVDTDVDTTMVN